MTLETFFEKFELFADAPDAMVRMRELVLEWASAGKLVEQSSADEPAATLVEQIEDHFAVLRSRGEMRGSPVEPLDPDNLSSIPQGWLWVRLGNVVDYGSSDKAESADIPDDAWLLDLEDIEKDTSRLLQRKTFRGSPSKSTKTAFSAGDVLYGKLRPYLNKILVADVPGYCTTEIIPIRTFGFIDPGYLCYALKRPAFLAYANSKSYGMNLPRLGTKDARLAAFPLPPLAEQKRIVAKVDELMALCDQLEAQQQERETRHAALALASLARFADAPTPANLDLLFHKSHSIPPADLRKSILTLAVQGKLVGRVVHDGTGSEILAAADVTEETPEDVPTLPDHWTWVRLGSITTRMDSGWSPACLTEQAEEGAWGVLKTTAVQTLEYHEVQNKALPPNLTPRPEHEVMDGDILFTRAGPMNRVGILCVARPTRRLLMLSDKIIRFQLVDGIDPDFVALALTAGYSNDVVQGLKSGMAASQVNISQPKLKSVPIPLPPLAEQRRIVAKVDELMALLDTLETQFATARTTAEKLMEAVVAELTAEA